MGIINFTMPEAGSFLVEIIIWLVKVSSSIALGIILFTVILKLITLPFDYASRASMRKNSLKLEEMRPELEKLQRQYADNKELYSQKMMALYKKNGYSMFGSCLPTILTLVIFIIAINAFTDYSQYQNKMDFYQMSQAYNKVAYAGFDINEENNEYFYRMDGSEILLNTDKILTELDINEEITVGNSVIKNTEILDENDKHVSYRIVIYSNNGYTEYRRDYRVDNEKGGYVFSPAQYVISSKAVETLSADNPTIACAENNYLKNAKGETFLQAYESVKNNENAPTIEQFADEFVNDIQSYLSAVKFREVQADFLWIKNIWITDSALKNPVMKEWEEFRVTHEYQGNNIGVAGYQKLIKHLDKEVNEPNGYFILVALTALTSLALQLVSAKSQKAQMELQTVDGQGAQTQKVMQWMMPIMMGFFAFMYTSAFSIYIIVSSIISILTTFGINAIVDVQIKKERAKKGTEEIRGRVYVPKEEKPEPKKEKKKKETTPENDFLSGKADNKQGKIRGIK